MVHNETIDLAGRLRLARERAGLSQGQAARILGFHRPTISEIEAGRRKVSAVELKDLAKLYSVSIPWIVGDSATVANLDDPRIEMIARRMDRLRKQDLDSLLQVIASFLDEQGT